MLYNQLEPIALRRLSNTASINPSLHTPWFTILYKNPHSHTPFAPSRPRSKSPGDNDSKNAINFILKQALALTKVSALDCESSTARWSVLYPVIVQLFNMF